MDGLDVTYTTILCERHTFHLDTLHHPHRPNEVAGHGWDVVVKAECAGRSSTARIVLMLPRESAIQCAQDMARTNLEASTTTY